MLCTVFAVITKVTAKYHDGFMMRESLQDWDQDRCYLKCLYNGNEVYYIE